MAVINMYLAAVIDENKVLERRVLEQDRLLAQQHVDTSVAKV